MLKLATWAAISLLACSGVFVDELPHGAYPDDPLTLVVMDPLCDRLACDCVEGYAQRKYEVLAEHLGKQMGRQVEIVWGESIHVALEETDFTPDIVIGKHSVVLGDANSLNQQFRPVARLTDQQGRVTQTGLIVVRKADPATTVAELTDYRIFFGPANCDEKHAAPMDLLREHDIEIPSNPEISGACSQAATQLMELDESVQAAAVISSYAEPLLSGCGTIEKGDLRVIGVSREVPFVTAFVNQNLDDSTQTAIARALLGIGEHAPILQALQSSRGFVAPETVSADAGTAASNAAAESSKKKLP